MPYGDFVVKRGSSAVLVLAFLIGASCGGSAAPAATGTTGATSTNAAVGTGTTASGAPSTAGASFGQILGSARTGEYKVTYKLSAAGAGEQAWYFKPPKARFDFSSNVSGQTSIVSIYALPDGTFMCFGGTGVTAQCIGMSGLDTALQQNPAALYQQSMFEHPEQFNAVLVETRQIAGQQAQCFDVKSTVVTATLGDGRFCYGSQGILLLQRFGAGGGPLDMEATSFSTTVPDSDFTLPSKPTILGKP
jgi:hypothetical protein